MEQVVESSVQKSLQSVTISGSGPGHDAGCQNVGTMVRKLTAAAAPSYRDSFSTRIAYKPVSCFYTFDTHTFP